MGHGRLDSILGSHLFFGGIYFSFYNPSYRLRLQKDGRIVNKVKESTASKI
jgi:hypothetical protein